MPRCRPQIRRRPPMRPLRAPLKVRPRAQARREGDRLDAHLHKPPGELLQQARALREVEAHVRELLHGVERRGPRGVGGARAGREAQSGGGLEVPVREGRGGVGPEHRPARHREDFGVHQLVV